MSPIFECINVCKNYSQGETEVHALKDVSLKIERGEFVSLCGPSGSGKSTLLNLLGGLDNPSDGKILFEGRDLSKLSRDERTDYRLHKVGFVFQSFNLIPVLSASENVEFVMQLQGRPRAERKKLAYELLQKVGLHGMENRRPGQLSGGQQQRVAVARAIVSNPAVILADEPTANLDSSTARQLLELMREMNRELGLTFIFSTHDAVVMEFAKRLIYLHDGVVEKDSVVEKMAASQ